MADITLGTLRDYWKSVYDSIVSNGSSSKTTGLQIAGTDGVNGRILKTDPDGDLKTSMLGGILAEQKTETDAVDNVITFSDNIYAIEIYHESEPRQPFTINGLIINIPSGNWKSLIGGTPGVTVTIPDGISCIVGRLV
jgi:hypothetical protein